MQKIYFGDRFITLGATGQSGNTKPEDVLPFGGREKLNKLLRDFAGNEQWRHVHLVHDDLEVLWAAVRSAYLCIDAGGGMVFNGDGEYLTIKRNGIWDLPKGKLDEGEDFETAALREVKEECGLAGLSMDRLFITTFHTYSMPEHEVLKETRWYLMHYSGDESPVLQAEEGISDYRWVKPGKSEFLVRNTYASILDVLAVADVL